VATSGRGSRRPAATSRSWSAHLAVLSKRFGEPAVLGGVVRIATQLTDQGDIVQLSPGADLMIGTQDGSRTDRLQATYDQLSGAGFDASISDEIRVIASITQIVTKADSDVNSSLSRDVAEGRPAEVEAVLADLARRGADHGVKTPLFDLATMQLRIYNNSLRASR
jgi:ketopantoate reductase